MATANAIRRIGTHICGAAPAASDTDSLAGYGDDDFEDETSIDEDLDGFGSGDASDTSSVDVPGLSPRGAAAAAAADESVYWSHPPDAAAAASPEPAAPATPAATPATPVAAPAADDEGPGSPALTSMARELANPSTFQFTHTRPLCFVRTHPTNQWWRSKGVAGGWAIVGIVAVEGSRVVMVDVLRTIPGFDGNTKMNPDAPTGAPGVLARSDERKAFYQFTANSQFDKSMALPYNTSDDPAVRGKPLFMLQRVAAFLTERGTAEPGPDPAATPGFGAPTPRRAKTKADTRTRNWVQANQEQLVFDLPGFVCRLKESQKNDHDGLGQPFGAPPGTTDPIEEATLTVQIPVWVKQSDDVDAEERLMEYRTGSGQITTVFTNAKGERRFYPITGNAKRPGTVSHLRVTPSRENFMVRPDEHAMDMIRSGRKTADLGISGTELRANVRMVFDASMVASTDNEKFWETTLPLYAWEVWGSYGAAGVPRPATYGDLHKVCGYTYGPLSIHVPTVVDGPVKALNKHAFTLRHVGVAELDYVPPVPRHGRRVGVTSRT